VYNDDREIKGFRERVNETQVSITMFSHLNTLLLRARNIPPTNKGKCEETRRVKAVLRENNYPSRFINECARALATKPTKPTTNGFLVLRYVKGVSERLGDAH